MILRNFSFAMERVASEPLIEKVPTFLEQIHQRRIEAAQRKEQAKIEQEKAKETEWQEFLKTSASPLAEGSKELHYALEWCKKEILKYCEDNKTVILVWLSEMNLKQQFSNWPLDHSLSGPYIPNMSLFIKERRFLHICLENLCIALKKEGLEATIDSTSRSGIRIVFA